MHFRDHSERSGRIYLLEPFSGLKSIIRERRISIRQKTPMSRICKSLTSQMKPVISEKNPKKICLSLSVIFFFFFWVQKVTLLRFKVNYRDTMSFDELSHVTLCLQLIENWMFSECQLDNISCSFVIAS